MANGNIYKIPSSDSVYTVSPEEGLNHKFDFGVNDIVNFRITPEGGLEIKFTDGQVMMIDNFDNLASSNSTIFEMNDGNVINPHDLFATLNGSEIIASNSPAGDSPIVISAPSENVTREIRMEEGQKIKFDFDISDADEILYEGDVLSMSFPNGSSIVLHGFDAFSGDMKGDMIAFADGDFISPAQVEYGYQIAKLGDVEVEEDVDVAKKETSVRETQMANDDISPEVIEEMLSIAPAAGEETLPSDGFKFEEKVEDTDADADAKNMEDVIKKIDNLPESQADVRDGNMSDMVAADLADIAPAAGGGAGGSSRGGFGFESNVDPANLNGLDDVGPINPTALNYNIPQFEDYNYLGNNQNGAVPPVSPSVDLPSHRVKEDGSVGINIFADSNGAGVELRISITGIGADWTVGGSVGSYDPATGVWSYVTTDTTFTGGPVLTPPAQSDVDISNLNVVVVNYDPATGLESKITGAFSVTVDAVADKPEIIADDISGNEGDAIDLDFTGKLGVDNFDGSEEIAAYQISGVPSGFSFNQGTNNGGGVWTFTPAQIAGLKINPVNSDYFGDFNLEVTVFNEDVYNDGEYDFSDNVNSATTKFNVEWKPVANPPEVGARIQGDSVYLLEDSSTGVVVYANLDNNGSGAEQLTVTAYVDPLWVLNGNANENSFTMENGPNGEAWVAGANAGEYVLEISTQNTNYEGVFTFTPAPDSDVDVPDITLNAVAYEPATDTYGYADEYVFNVIVDAVADTPNLNANDVVHESDDVNVTSVNLDISAAVTDIDGSETLTEVRIEEVPSGYTITGATETVSGSGTWVVDDVTQLDQLKLNVFAGAEEEIYLKVVAVATETNLSDREYEDSNGNFVYDNNSAGNTTRFKVVITNDDVPEITKITDANVDDTNLQFGDDVVTGSVSAEYFNDGPGEVVGTNSFVSGGSLKDGNLTSAGVAVVVTYAAGVYTGMAGATEVFTLELATDGNYKFTLKAPLDHGDVNDANDAITLSFGIKAVDADGDDTDERFINITAYDDGLIAEDDSATIAYGDDEVSGNVVVNDDFSQDVDNNVTKIAFGANEVDVPETGTATIEGNYGVLEIAADGNYTYRIKPVSDWPNGGTPEVHTFAAEEIDAAGLQDVITKDDITISVGNPTNGDFVWRDTSKHGTGVGLGIDDLDSSSDSTKVWPAGESIVISAAKEAAKYEITVADIGDNNIGDGLDYKVTLADDTVVDGEVIMEAGNISGGLFTLTIESSDYGQAIKSVEVYSIDGGVAGGNRASFLLNSVEVTYPYEKGDDDFVYTLTDSDGDSNNAVLSINGEYYKPNPPFVEANNFYIFEDSALAFGEEAGQHPAVIDFVASHPASASSDAVLTVALVGIDVSGGWSVDVSQSGGSFNPATGQWTLVLPAGENFTSSMVGPSLIPPADSDIDHPAGLQLVVSSYEPVYQTTEVTTKDISIVVDSVADIPNLNANDVSGESDEHGVSVVNLDISSAVADIDGSEAITEVRIEGVPAGYTITGAVETSANSGIWIVDDVTQLDKLELNVPAKAEKEFELVVKATASEANQTDEECECAPDNNSAMNEVRFNVSIDRDYQPTITKPSKKTVDDTNLDSGDDVVTGVVQANFYGDNPGVFAPTTASSFNYYGSYAGAGLSSAGVAVVVAVVGNSYVGTAGATEVFRLDIDENTGNYTFTLKAPLDHADTSNDNEAIYMSFGVRAVDADGDEAETIIRIRALDDGLAAEDDSATIAYGDTDVTGNVVVNDDISQDVDNNVTKIAFGTNEVVVPEAGVATIDGSYGQLKIDADGDYTYTLFDYSQWPNGGYIEGDTNEYVAQESDVENSIQRSISKNGITIQVGDNITNADLVWRDTSKHGTGVGIGIDNLDSNDSTKIWPQGETLKIISDEGAAAKFTITVADIGDNNIGDGIDYEVTLADGNKVTGEVIMNPSDVNGGLFTFTLAGADFGAGALIESVDIYSVDGGVLDGERASFLLNSVKVDLPDIYEKPNDEFIYTLTDADGDSDTAILRIDGEGGSYTAPHVTVVSNYEGLVYTETKYDHEFIDCVKFPELVEGQPLDAPEYAAVGIDYNDFDINYQTTGSISFVSEGAGYENTLGVYDIADDGSIVGVRFLIVDAESAINGDSISFDIAGANGNGMDLGFFVVANGYSINNGYAGLDLDNGSLSFVYGYGQVGERVARTTDTADDITLIYTDSNGAETIISGPVYHTVQRGVNENINPDGMNHVVSGLADLNDNSTLRIGFEDLPNLGDKDYQDIIFDFTVEPNTVYSFSPVTVANDVRINDLYSDVIRAATVTIGEGYKTGDVLEVTYDAGLSVVSSDDGSVVITGEATKAVYEQVLESITLTSDDSNIVDGLRVINYQVQDVDGFDSNLEAAYVPVVKDFTMFATSGDDAPVGFDDGEVFATGEGNDIVDGGAGDDLIRGEAGDDTLFGNDGRDVLIGGEGNDVLYGNNDADIFVFQSLTDGVDNIADFDAMEGDIIDISALLEEYNPLTDSINDFVYATEDTGNTIISIDVNGTNNAANANEIVVVDNVTGVSVDDLINNGLLDVA